MAVKYNLFYCLALTNVPPLQLGRLGSSVNFLDSCGHAPHLFIVWGTDPGIHPRSGLRVIQNSQVLGSWRMVWRV